MIEQWRPIKNYKGIYEISNLGNVKSLARTIIKKDGKKQTFKERILNKRHNGYGYYQVGLNNKGKRIYFYIHRLVGEAFIDNPSNLSQINHVNGNKEDNSVNNLEWVSAKDNTIHSWKTGLSKGGENHGMSKLTNNEVLEIRKKYLSKNYSQRKLAKEYNVSQKTIYNIINKKQWKLVE
ncbi:TPA: NUMOD4 domain-containing protein [Staphylococcus aureus]